jgi:hypothetical protein
VSERAHRWFRGSRLVGFPFPLLPVLFVSKRKMLPSYFSPVSACGGEQTSACGSANSRRRGEGGRGGPLALSTRVGVAGGGGGRRARAAEAAGVWERGRTGAGSSRIGASARGAGPGVVGAATAGFL